MKKLYILAGANGSGKSTISKVLLPAESLVYVNPDDIAREINPAEPTAAKIEAGKETLKRIEELFAAGTSFAIESTLSGNVYLKVIEKAKSLGYETAIIYTFLDNPEVCIARIAVRVKTGGHYVPDEDVRRRFYRSKKNFIEKYSKAVDKWVMLYNGGCNIAIAAYGESDIHVLSKHLFKLFMEGVADA
ncbi:MAG: zeta toxin family protein [Kiritimatiellae bacterium]|nr:zeta toxin family protein [Kiritimatiellia bacterium]